jgi:hypothetical protein
MKVQCACGAKYVFDITPAMRSNPVQFICPACGMDASQFVDGLVRQELGQATAPFGQPISVLTGAPTTAAVPTGVLLDDSATAPAPPPAAAPRAALAVRVSTPQANLDAAGAAPAFAEGRPCLKHPGEMATEKCYVCSKPICPKCMELFGYVCSPLCKAKADSHGIQVPVYEFQKSVVEARQWRKTVLVGCGAGGVLAAFLGVWFWYAWFGCMPHPIFTVRFPERSYAGQSVLGGKDHDQVVFLHGGTLARYELKSKKEIWSLQLIDRKEIEVKANQEIRSMEADNVKIRDRGGSGMRLPFIDELVNDMVRSAEEEMSLHVRGQNVWVAYPGKLVRYDWNTGKRDKELTVQSGFGGLISRGDELLLVDSVLGKPIVTHIDLVTGESRTEDLTSAEAKALASATTNSPGGGGAAKTPRGSTMAGLPTVPGKDIGKPMDPGKVAEQASHLSLPARIALPATISSVMTQEKTLKAMDDDSDSGAGAGFLPQNVFSLIPAKDGFVEFSTKMLEHRVEQRNAMKAAPAKSALEGNVSAGKSLEIANEMLNEMQRERGGNMIEEDVSRYQVILRRPDTQESWTGEVIGAAQVFPLDTVNVLTSTKSVMVFDKHNKRLWQSSLNYKVVRGLGALDEESATYGQGPCVERKGSLYVFDEGVLTAFDLATGNVRWRLPSVGIAGLFFDDEDNIYMNTTTASPDSIKYSRQIDISDKVRSVVMKVDSRKGKVLWSAEPGGLVNYVYGKVILVAQSYRPVDEDNDGPAAGFATPAHLRIRRINARNGHEVWEYFQQRAPLDIGFEKNTIRLVYRKEVQVLKFATF